LNKIIKHTFNSLVNIGLNEELSPINIVRYRVINIINYLITLGAFLFLAYRIYYFDFLSVVINTSLIGLMGLNIFLCKNLKHDIAIKLTAIHLAALSFNLCSSELFISGTIYLSVLPMAFCLMHKEPLVKHLYYVVCIIIFTYFSYRLNLPSTILFTYYIVTFGFYIMFLSFFNLVEQKQSELEIVVASLETKNAELRQYNHITSHDLQEPLGIINNFSQILSTRYSQSLDEIGRTSLHHIQSASNRMSALIKGLLDYALIGNSGVHEPIVIGELIKNIRKILHSTLEAANAEIIVDDIPIIFGHKAEIQILFQQLIVNAIKFKRPGLNPIIRISVTEKDAHWQFAIKDNGIGIEQAHLTKIFDIFQRLHTREEYEGYGIGLSHCKKIVQSHGGNIWVASTPNHGSTFCFTIPRKMILNQAGRFKEYL